MEKFYTSLKSKAFALFISFGLFSSATGYSQQICGPIVEDFDNTSGSNAGFIGDFNLATTGTDGYLQKSRVLASGIYTITTPTYELPASASFIGYGFILDGSNRVASVEAAIIYQSTLNNEITTVFLSQFIPNYDLNATPPTADVCRVVSLSELPGFPTNGKYRLRFEFSSNVGAGGVNENMTFDDFRTNGTLAQSPLPVNFIGFDARRMSNGVQLIWKVAGEENVSHYEVERSTDGRSFAKVGRVEIDKKDTYTFFDENRASTVYYRIKNVDMDGQYKYSTIARIKNGKSEIVLKAFPQPVASQLTIQHPVNKNNTMITISTADGRVIKTIKPTAGSMQSYIDMSNLQRGLYLVRYDAGDGNVETMKVVKQ